MSSNYGHLNNDESNESEFKRNPVRRSLRLRLTRVFSSGSLKSLKSPGYSNLSDSPNSPEISSAIKTRYSWQNNNLKNILSNSPRSSVSSTSCNDSINSLTFMEIIKPPENNDENKMKYSPQQQQKERKSESEVASMIATPSRTSRSKNSVHGCSSNRIINNTVSTGIFAWMRVFRMASLLHKIGC